MGGQALLLAELGQVSEDDRARLEVGGDGIDEDDIPPFAPGDIGDEVLGNVLDDKDRPGRPLEALGQPDADAVVAAHRVADPDEAGAFFQDIFESGHDVL